MKSTKLKATLFVLLIISLTVMTSGCGQSEEEAQAENEDYWKQVNNTTKNTTKDVEQTKKESTSDNKETTTTTEKTSTPTKTESCSHPSVTTKYVGLDKATGKVIYDTYCSKCGEYLGRVLY